MVQVDIDERTYNILNSFKEKKGLEDAGAAIEYIVAEYEEELIEPELNPEFNPEFIEHINKIEKQKPIHVGTVEDLRKRYE